MQSRRSILLRSQNLLRGISGQYEVVLVILLITIIFMIILPLPTWLVDFFIGCNIGLVLLILVIVFYLKSPSDLSTLPSLLLFATVFRLAISISTTRLILSEADAGEIVLAFGNFVVGGSIIIGMVVFLIITIVQFIVITKGSERVAEVSARFALDSLPGKQLSIDSDLRAGEIDIEEAKRRRTKLRVENDFYGAMDGAMKFVKGDAIAGIIIIAVNLIGGMGVGVAQNGMALGDAVQIYSVLTVGDGLVSQVPALIMAIGTGIAITRIAKSDEDEDVNLGSDIIYELAGSGRELAIAGFAMVLFALVPGFPPITFLSLAALFGLAAYAVSRRSRQDVDMTSLEEGTKVDYQVPTIIRLEVAQSLLKTLNAEKLSENLGGIRARLYAEIGIPFPEVSVLQISDGKKDNWKLVIEGVKAVSGNFPLEKVNVIDAVQDLEATELEFETMKFRSVELKWVERSQTEALTDLGLNFQDMEDVICKFVEKELPSYAEEIIGVEEASKLLDVMEKRYQTLVTAVRKIAPPEQLTLILRPLVAEKVPLTNFRIVMEAILEWGPKESDPSALSEFVRIALARQISDQYANEDHKIPAYILDPEAEVLLRDSLMHNSLGSFLTLTAEQSQIMIENVSAAIGNVDENEPVLITAMDIRQHMRKFLKNNGFDFPVLSHKEIHSDIEIFPLGIINAS